MEYFNFFAKTNVMFGLGIIDTLGDYVIQECGKPHTMLISDPGLEKAGLVDKIRKILTDKGLDVTVFTEIEQNPRLETVEKVAKIAADKKSKCVIGLGGGSAMDSAKLVGNLVSHGGSITDYVGVNKVPGPTIPVIAIPTTSGTASEVTGNAVVTQKDKKFKAVCFSNYLLPKAAFLDPELTITLPRSITASTGMDAITHAIESYTNIVWNPVSEALAGKAIRLISENLRKAVYNGDDKAARYNMMLGSYLAGLAFNFTVCGVVHAMSHPLSGYYDIPHGVANAVLLPVVSEFNLPACIDESIKVAEFLGEKTEGLPKWKAAEKFIEAIQKLNDDVGIPRDFKHLKATEEDILGMTEDSMFSKNVAINPRKVSKEDIYNLYKIVM